MLRRWRHRRTCTTWPRCTSRATALGMRARGRWPRHPTCFALTTWTWGYNRIGDEGAAALAASPMFSTLSHLGLPGNLLTNAGAMALASSPQLGRLTGLTLWECKKIGAKGKEALKARFGQTVSFED